MRYLSTTICNHKVKGTWERKSLHRRIHFSYFQGYIIPPPLPNISVPSLTFNLVM